MIEETLSETSKEKKLKLTNIIYLPRKHLRECQTQLGFLSL